MRIKNYNDIISMKKLYFSGPMSSGAPPPLTPEQSGYRPIYPPHLKQEHNRPIMQPVHDERSQMTMSGMNPMSSMHHNKHSAYHDQPSMQSAPQHQHGEYLPQSGIPTHPSMHPAHLQSPTSSMYKCIVLLNR